MTGIVNMVYSQFFLVRHENNMRNLSISLKFYFMLKLPWWALINSYLQKWKGTHSDILMAYLLAMGVAHNH